MSNTGDTTDKGSCENWTARWPATAFRELLHRPSTQLPALDGLRAMAVLLVICDHWRSEWVDIARLPVLQVMRLPAFYWGWTGVDLFFVLSGFLIGKQLWAEIYRSGTISMSAFVIRRGLRIWPLYYATMIALVYLGVPGAPSWSDWVMLSNYVISHYGRGWSLSTEEQFYIVMPTLLLLLNKFASKRWWPLWIAGLLPLVVAARYFTFQSLSDQGIERSYILGRLMYAPFHLHCEPLLAGFLIGWIAVRRPRWISPVSAGKVATRVLCIGAIASLVGLSLRAMNREAFPYVGLAAVYGSALCAALADRSWVTAILRWRIWYPIARLSFGMYLNHLMLPELTRGTIVYAESVFGPQTTSAFLAGLVVSVVISAAMAAATYVLIEAPGLAVRDQILHRRKRIASAS